MRKIIFSSLIIFLSLVVLSSCTPDFKTQLIVYGKDTCEHCHMTIVDPRFGAQIQTNKGKVFLFDSVNCLHNYLKTHSIKTKKIYFVNSLQKDQWIEQEKAYFGVFNGIRSPMGQGIFSAASREALSQVPAHAAVSSASPPIKLQGMMTWDQLSLELMAGKYQ